MKIVYQQKNYDGYHANNEDLNYYDMNKYSKNETSVNFTLSKVVKLFQAHCRWCRQIFQFNNVLHQHIRNDCSKIKKIDLTTKNFKPLSSSTKSFKLSSFSITAKNFSSLSTAVFKQSSSKSTVADNIISNITNEIILSNIDFASDIDTDYDFKNWTYAKTKVVLSFIDQSKIDCLDIEIEMTLSNREFYKRQNFNDIIRIMITFLKIRDLNTHRHESAEYVICDIHLKKEKNDKSITSILRREVHLINNFKANMLIDNDVIESKEIIINSIKKQTFITSTNATISIEVRLSKNNIQRSIHIRKTTIVSFHTEIIVFINNTSLPESRNFLFESTDDVNFTFYAHLVDASTFVVVVRNDCDQFIQIPRNFKLNRISELNYSNAFQVSSEQVEKIKSLAARKSKFTHKNGWFKKFLTACATTYAIATAVLVDNVLFVNSDIELSIATLSTSSAVNTIILVIFIDSSPKSLKLMLPNDVTIHRSNAANFFVKIVKEFSIIWHDIDFVDLSEKNWMRISLKSDWKNKIIDKVKIYSLNTKNKALINKTFDELHVADKMSWTTESTFFFYSIFCVWKSDVDDDDLQKSRSIINIKSLNVITQSNAYSLPLQSEIIVAVRNCLYISVIDYFVFFYQWRVHFSNRHKLTVINHREQKSFNITMINFKNSSTYVQKQIDRLLRLHRKYARVYVDDIIVFFKTKEKHKTHLRAVFFVLKDNNIFIKFTKAFIEYFSVSLLDQKVNSLNLAIAVEKLRVIVKLRFFYNLRQLKPYLNLIDWMKNYIPYYVDISKSLQKRKTELLRHESFVENDRRSYVFKTRLKKPIDLKKEFFKTLQKLLSKFFYLVHIDSRRSLFINLNASKKFDFEAHLYYVKKKCLKNFQSEQFSSRHFIESIFFFNRLLTSIKIRYWSTELKIVDIVWVLKKVRHIIKTSNQSTSIVIYIDHGAAFDIAKQTSLFTSFTNKLNFRLMRALNYIQRFNLDIRHKSSKQHIISNVFSRLTSDNINVFNHDNELNALFTISLIEMNSNFKQRILNDYKSDLN